MAAEELLPIVIDNGSDMIKAGFSDDVPHAVFPSVVGYVRPGGYSHLKREKSFYVADDAVSKRGLLRMVYPIERGIVTDFDVMKRLWTHTIRNELRANPEAHPVLLTEPPLNPNANRITTTEMMFESYFVPSFYLANSAKLALTASGRSSGVVIDSGHLGAYIVPIYQDCVQTDQISQLSFGGRHITDHLLNLMIAKGYTTSGRAERDILRDIKEKLGYIAEDVDQERARYSETGGANGRLYELPDGELLRVGDEAFMCAEALFQPSALGLDEPGIHQRTHNSIIQCGLETRDVLFSNIVLCGGTSLFRGFSERLTKELRALNPNMDIQVHTPELRRYLVYLGGAMMASLSTFKDMAITKQMYDEVGAHIVLSKCV